MYARKDLEKKSELELVAIGTSEFGIKLNADAMTKVQLIDALLDAQEVKAVPKLSRVEEEEDPKFKTDDAFRHRSKKYRLIIHNQDGVDNMPFVAVGINGFVYQIPREVEVQVPQEVIDTLNNAIQTVPETTEDGKSMTTRDRRRFPYTVLGTV